MSSRVRGLTQTKFYRPGQTFDGSLVLGTSNSVPMPLSDAWKMRYQVREWLATATGTHPGDAGGTSPFTASAVLRPVDAGAVDVDDEIPLTLEEGFSFLDVDQGGSGPQIATIAFDSAFALGAVLTHVPRSLYSGINGSYSATVTIETAGANDWVGTVSAPTTIMGHSCVGAASASAGDVIFSVSLTPYSFWPYDGVRDAATGLSLLSIRQQPM